MLLKKLQEEMDHQEALAIERRQQRGGATDAADDAAGAPAEGDQGAEKPGMKQQDLVDWYMEMQINRCGAGAHGVCMAWPGAPARGAHRCMHAHAAPVKVRMQAPNRRMRALRPALCASAGRRSPPTRTARPSTTWCSR